MRAIRSKNTQPELLVRRLSHRLGYRFRLHGALLPGKPDLVFPRHRKVIFVHGCFWHSHNHPNCRNSQTPKSNTSYWVPKLAGNVKRDTEHLARLRADGWKVLTIWECETKETAKLGKRLLRFLSN